MAEMKQHTAPVTTVEWHPSDASVLASGGEDNQVLQWDLAVERDEQEGVEDDMVSTEVHSVYCLLGCRKHELVESESYNLSSTIFCKYCITFYAQSVYFKP